VAIYVKKKDIVISVLKHNGIEKVKGSGSRYGKPKSSDLNPMPPMRRNLSPHSFCSFSPTSRTLHPFHQFPPFYLPLSLFLPQERARRFPHPPGAFCSCQSVQRRLNCRLLHESCRMRDHIFYRRVHRPISRTKKQSSNHLFGSQRMTAGAVGYLIGLRRSTLLVGEGAQEPHLGEDVMVAEQLVSCLLHLGHAHSLQLAPEAETEIMTPGYH
jgi:hypothetical protein